MFRECPFYAQRHDSSEYDSSSDEDNSVFFYDSSSSVTNDSSYHTDKNEYNDHKQELQRLLNSGDPRDKASLNIKITNIVKFDYDTLFMYLIENNYKLEILNDKRQTAFHLAWYHTRDIINLIAHFPNYIDTNDTDYNGLSYLHIASSIAHVEMVDIFLKKGADINAQFHTDPKGMQDGFRPLHFAATTLLPESVKVMKLLLKNGADVNAVDSLGRTPLHIACRNSKELFSFADILYTCGSLTLIKILLKSGSDLSTRDYNGNTAVLSIVHDDYNQFDFESEEDFNYTLYKAIKDKLRYFLKKSIDISEINNDGNTILHRIIENLKLSRYTNNFTVHFLNDAKYAKMVKQIITANKGINVNARNCFGETPLQLAVSLMSYDIVKILLKHNIDFSSLTFNHNDQYCFCCPNFYPKLDMVQKVISIIKLLLKKGWKLTLKDNLSLMKFLVHDIDNCECENLSIVDYKLETNLCHLIDYGFSKHLQEIINKNVRFQSSLIKGHLIHRISKMLHYRKVFNLYVDETIPDIIKKFHTKRYVFEDSLLNCKNDIVRMKHIKLNGNMTLYDVMTRHPYKIYRYVKNRNFYKITERFTCLNIAVIGHVAQSLVRHHVEKLAVNYLRILLFPSIPNLCSKKIFSFLSNVDILNMCSAAILEDTS